MNPISPDPTVPTGDRRPILLGGAGAAGLLLGLVLLMALGGADDAPAPYAPPTTAAPTPEEPEPPAAIDPELAFSIFRDPFEQLVTVPDAEPVTGPVPAEAPAPAPAPLPATDPPPPAGATATNDAVAPNDAPQPTGSPPAPPPQDDPPTPGIWYFPASPPPAAQQPPPHPPPPHPPPPHQPPPHQPPQERPPGMIDDPLQVVRWLLEWFRLQWVVTDDAGSSRAVVTMGDQVYFPAEGEVFADHFFVESINPDCVEVSVTEFDLGICVPTPDQAGDATPNDPTATQACVVARPALPSEGADRPRLGLMPCERVAPEVRFAVGGPE